jgi:hypothetical protein
MLGEKVFRHMTVADHTDRWTEQGLPQLIPYALLLTAPLAADGVRGGGVGAGGVETIAPIPTASASMGGSSRHSKQDM